MMRRAFAPAARVSVDCGPAHAHRLLCALGCRCWPLACSRRPAADRPRSAAATARSRTGAARRTGPACARTCSTRAPTVQCKGARARDLMCVAGSGGACPCVRPRAGCVYVRAGGSVCGLRAALAPGQRLTRVRAVQPRPHRRRRGRNHRTGTLRRAPVAAYTPHLTKAHRLRVVPALRWCARRWRAGVAPTSSPSRSRGRSCTLMCPTPPTAPAPTAASWSHSSKQASARASPADLPLFLPS